MIQYTHDRIKTQQSETEAILNKGSLFKNSYNKKGISTIHVAIH